MNTATPDTRLPAERSLRWSSRAVAAGAAILLGLTLLFAAGFANSQVLHQAAHDTRHGLGFPCH